MPRFYRRKKLRKGGKRKYKTRFTKRVPKSNRALEALIMRQTKSETKYIVGQIAAQNCDWTGAIVSMSPYIAQGLTASTRVGNHIHIKHVILRYSITSLFATLPGYNVRIVIGVYEGAAAPTVVQILGQTGTAYSTKSFYTTGQVGNFKILHDKICTVNGGASNSMISRYVKVPINHFANYSTAAIGYPTNRRLFLIYIGDITPANEQPTITAQYKVYYADK